MNNRRILIIDTMHESLIPMLTEAGLVPDYHPDITREEIIGLEQQYAGMIVRSKTPVDAELLHNQKEIKFVGRAGAGIDNLDVEYLESKKIKIINAPEGNRDALGEHVLGMLLSLSNNLRQGDRQVRAGIWDREGNRGFEIKGKTVALLGYGYMGSAFAEKLSGFGCEVIAYDKYKSGYTNEYVKEASMDEVFERADIFSLHVPLTDETKDLVDAEFLSRFKKHILLINSARGEVVVTEDLVSALQSGKVTHAALDVLENEKLKKLTEQQQKTYTELFQLPNVLLSPHVAGWTLESYLRINEVLVEKMKGLWR